MKTFYDRLEEGVPKGLDGMLLDEPLQRDHRILRMWFRAILGFGILLGIITLGLVMRGV
jgi:hypothetical protein